jgi:uncharacterized protein (TIGR02453 family)
MFVMAFKGWPVEAVEFYEDLEADNSKTFWQEHKSVYERSVKGPTEELLAELEDDFGAGRVFRPYRDLRFSKDKTPYKLNCAAHLRGGYISFSADELFIGSGLYIPEPAQLQRFRGAVDNARSGSDLESIVATLRNDGYDVGAHDLLTTAPKGFPKDHPRIELLKHKGIVMSRSWPVGAWIGTRKAKDQSSRAWMPPVPSTPGSSATSADVNRTRGSGALEFAGVGQVPGTIPAAESSWGAVITTRRPVTVDRTYRRDGSGRTRVELPSDEVAGTHPTRVCPLPERQVGPRRAAGGGQHLDALKGFLDTARSQRMGVGEGMEEHSGKVAVHHWHAARRTLT